MNFTTLLMNRLARPAALQIHRCAAQLPTVFFAILAAENDYNQMRTLEDFACKSIPLNSQTVASITLVLLADLPICQRTKKVLRHNL